MIQRLLEILIYWFVAIPVLTFAHELGHATAALILSCNPVTIQLGSIDGGGPNVSVGRLKIVLAWRLNWLSPTIGFYHVDHSDLTIRQKVIVVLCGPLASVIVAIFLEFLSFRIHLSSIAFFLHITATLAFLQFLLTAIPMTYPAWFGGGKGLPSDGKQIQNYHRLAALTLAQRKVEELMASDKS